MDEWNTTDPILEFPVVSPEGFPHGLRCCICHREIADGQPFKSVEQSIYENGDVLTLLMCVYCPSESSDE